MSDQNQEARKTYTLRKGMPPDVYDIVIREQGVFKIKKRRAQFSIEDTIYELIRNFDKLKRLNQCPE